MWEYKQRKKRLSVLTDCGALVAAVVGGVICWGFIILVFSFFALIQ